MIEVEQLTKDYGTVVAVRELSFRVGKGEVVGFLGPNGAGKSTTLRILAGFLGATSGRVRIAGYDIAEQSLEARQAMGYMPESTPLYPELRVGEYLRFRARLKRIAGYDIGEQSLEARQAMGYMPESTPLYPELRVGEYLRFRARLKRISGKAQRAEVERSMELASVSDMADTLIRHLSKGYRQRVGLADALLGRPPLLILDEPTAGLDPNQIREVRSVIKDLGSEFTILVSTHILSEVEATCTRALVIHRGQLVAEGDLDSLRASLGAVGAKLRIRGALEQASAIIRALAAVTKVTAEPVAGGAPDEATLRLELAESSDVDAVLDAAVAALVKAGIGVREAAPDKASLEEVFAQLTAEPDEEGTP